jgi:hypothetical protein
MVVSEAIKRKQVDAAICGRTIANSNMSFKAEYPPQLRSHANTVVASPARLSELCKAETHA